MVLYTPHGPQILGILGSQEQAKGKGQVNVMANSLSDFARRMEKRADKVEVLGNELAKAGTIAAIETLIDITPVDTSEHLSNWQISLGAPASSKLPPYVPGRKGSTRGVSSNDAKSAAARELEPRTSEQDIYISNLGPAIVKLDQGWSNQFAGGFVPRAVLVFRETIRSKISSLLKI